MQLDNMLLNLYSSKCVEIQCSLNDAPSPVHARQMNDAHIRSIRMLIEICPKTNHQKLISKREKEMGVGRHASHIRTLITTVCPVDGGSE